DGPHEVWTPRVLDLLASHDVKAIFFLIGREVERHPTLAASIQQKGHILANHTYSHSLLPSLSTTAALSEIERCQRIIEPLGGKRLFRPPHGLLTARQLFMTIRKRFQLAYWTVDSEDYRGASGHQI